MNDINVTETFCLVKKTQTKTGTKPFRFNGQMLRFNQMLHPGIYGCKECALHPFL